MKCDPQQLLSMPFKVWPEQDQALWRATQDIKPFEIAPKPLTKWSIGQRHSALRNYGLWLRFLDNTEPSLLTHALGDRMSAQRLSQFFAGRMRDIAVTTLAKCACDLYGVMVSLAPKQDWDWLKQMRRLTSAHAKQQLPKARAFTHGLELIRVGRELIDVAFAGGAEIRDPIAFRDGLIILVLILVPVRITQFSLIKLDRHLVRSPEGEWLLRWQAEETKTRRDAIHPVPEELVEILQLYISDVRPALMQKSKALENATATALWIGVSGRPISGIHPV